MSAVHNHVEKISRFKDVDFSKGVLIYLMAMFHIKYVGNQKDMMTNLTFIIYSFHMPAFLVFSGMFSNLKKDYKIQLRNTFRRLFIPYVFFEVLYTMSLYFAGKLGFKFANTVGTISLSSLLNQVLLRPIGAYWFLHTLIIGTAVVYLINHFFSNKTSALIVTGITYWLISIIVPGFIFHNALYLLIGYFFQYQKVNVEKSVWSLLCLVIMFFIIVPPTLDRGSLSVVIITILVISFLGFLYYFFNHYRLTSHINRIFVFSGTNTLTVMLLHPIFINVCKAFQNIFLGLDKSGIVYLFLTTIISVNASIFGGYVMDKIRVSRILFGRQIYVVYTEK